MIIYLQNAITIEYNISAFFIYIIIYIILSYVFHTRRLGWYEYTGPLDCAIFKMEVDCTLLLPEEVLELVFLQRVLSVSDLFRVAGTCRRFRVVVDRLWSKIARKR